MSGKFTNKTAQIAVTVLIGVIILSFILTSVGSGGLGSSASNVAEVGDYPVTVQEYRQALNQVQQQYANIFKGQSIPQTLIDTMQKSALGRLVNQKIVLNIADKLGFHVPSAQVKETIKKQDYFLTEKNFDFSKYKNLLKANGFTPKGYEDRVASDIKTQKFYNTFSTLNVSQNYTKYLLNLKETSLPMTYAKVENYPLREFIAVSTKEIKDFVSSPDNKATLDSMYQANSAEYKKPKKYVLKKIFLSKLGKDKSKIAAQTKELKSKLTRSNFSKLAIEKSDDPQTKSSGGAMGTFDATTIPKDFKTAALKLKAGGISEVIESSLGFNIIHLERVIPAVNVALTSVQDKLAKEAIQKKKTKELAELYKEVSIKINTYFSKGDINKARTYAKKYNIEVKTGNLNQLTNTINDLKLTDSETKELFTLAAKKVKSIDKVTYTLVTQVTDKAITPDLTNIKQKVDAQNGLLHSSLSQGLIDKFKESSPIKYNNAILSNGR